MSSDEQIFVGIILLIVAQSIYTLILTPLSIYHAHKFYKLSQRNIPFFTKRHPKIVMFTIFIYNVYPIIILPISSFLWIFYLSGIVYFGDNILLLCRLLTSTIQLLPYATVTRLWILFFQYKHGLQSLSIIWKNQITKKQNYTPWTAKYKYLGSTAVLFTIYGILSIIIFLYSLCGLMILGQSQYVSYLQWIAILPVIFLLILIFKIRKCRDQFAIQSEFTLFVIANSLVIICYGAIIVPFFGIYSVSRIIIINITMSSGCYSYCFIPTYWVINKYNKQEKCYETLTKQTVENIHHKNMTLQEILTTKDGFDLITHHLVREFSIESLLFLFEMMQIKNQLLNKHLLDENEIGIVIGMNCERINKNRREDGNIVSTDTLKDNLQHIVDTYICDDSEHSINISSKTRQKILASFAKVKVEVYNVPKYDWMDTRAVYRTQSTTSFGSPEEEEWSDLEQKTPKHVQTMHMHKMQRMKGVDGEDDEYSKLEMNSPVKVPRMNAINIDDVTIEPLQEAPTYEWMGKKGNNTIENEKYDKDNKLMIEYLQTFDKAMSEIINLLNGDSLLRFYSTSDYQRVLKEFVSLNSNNTTQCFV